jgi:hypothetical protein
MRAIGFAVIVSGLIVPFSAEADSVIFTYTFPSTLAGYMSANGTSFDQINPSLGILNLITLQATATADWSGGGDTEPQRS